jgi:DNA primase
MTLLELINGYTTLRKVAATHGGEYAGACPFCGGQDRFRVWPASEKPGWWCRQCDRKGDAIQFLRDRQGLTFREACARLGHPLPDAPRRGPTPKPPPLATPPSETWQAQARAFVEACERALWSPAGAEVRAYVRGRGLQDDTLQAAHIGYHAEGGHEPWEQWGVTPGSQRKGLWLPRGLVFPWWSGGALWRVTFRRLALPGTAIHELGTVDGDSHFMVQGSANLLYNIDGVRPNAPAMLVEAPLDALSVIQEAGDLVSVVAASTGWGRLERWIGRLALASVVLMSFDADDAGESAAAWWRKALRSRAKRWRPYWEDPNAMLQAGVDLRSWIREGLGQEPRWWRDMARWPEDRREEWGERSSIMAIDGGLSREAAEQEAYALLAERPKDPGREALPPQQRDEEETAIC